MIRLTRRAMLSGWLAVFALSRAALAQCVAVLPNLTDETTGQILMDDAGAQNLTAES